MASYLFGEIDVPNLEDESCPISPYDSTRSLALNPNHPLAQKLEAFIGQSLETVRQGLLAEKRKQQEEARHRELENEAKKLTELFNQACADIYIEFDFRQNERLLGKGPILDSDGLDLVGGLGTDGVGSNGSAYTRERVRQIEVRFFEHLLSSFTWFPQWNQFFDFWKDLPVSINVMGAVEPFYQFHKGQWNKGVPLLFLHTVMERMTPELENGRIIVLKDNLQTLTRLEPRMTRVESRHYRELVDEYKEASGVLVSESLSGTGKQLLERKGWRLIDEYYFSKVPQPPWVGALRKILSITENISLSEFRKLAFYDPRITWLPPAKTLIKLVPWLCEFASIDGYNINRATMLNRKEQLGALENAIVDAFESSGKHILSVDQIVEYANRLQQERFETSSVLQYTSRSVILDRIPRTGLRFLVGTQISPTQIEAAKESLKGIGNRRGILGYTWVNRNLLLLYRLGSLPTFYIPKVCSNVLSGTFRIIAPAHGIIKIRNGLAWGASPIIRRFQSSGSRRVMYIFDPDTHEVSMVFGDDSLCIPSM
jgi:hypothetical protein